MGFLLSVILTQVFTGLKETKNEDETMNKKELSISFIILGLGGSSWLDLRLDC